MRSFLSAVSTLALLASIGLHDAQAGPSLSVEHGASDGDGQANAAVADTDADAGVRGAIDADLDAALNEDQVEADAEVGDDAPRPVFQVGIGNVDSEEAPALFRALDGFSGATAGLQVDTPRVGRIGSASLSAQSVVGGR